MVGFGRPLLLGHEPMLTKATLNMMMVKQPTSCNPSSCRFKRDTDVNDTQHNMVDNTTSVVWLKPAWCCHFKKKIMG